MAPAKVLISNPHAEQPFRQPSLLQLLVISLPHLTSSCNIIPLWLLLPSFPPDPGFIFPPSHKPSSDHKSPERKESQNFKGKTNQLQSSVNINACSCPDPHLEMSKLRHRGVMFCPKLHKGGLRSRGPNSLTHALFTVLQFS